MNQELAQIISESLIGINPDFKVNQFQPVHGGDINESYLVVGNEDSFFLKLNNTSKLPYFFESEKYGLELLKKNSTFKIPNVHCIEKKGEHSFMVMETIKTGTPSESFWSEFGKKLAALHRCTFEKFGLDKDNYIGTIPQINHQKESWAEFYVNNRLQNTLEIAFNKNRLKSGFAPLMERLFQKIENLFPIEPPALIHGDLWSGNFMVSQFGEPVLVDPSVYFGHREMDFGMMKLFGGFSNELFDSYEVEYPIENGWKERIPLCQLYPLMVHVILFGGGYVDQVKRILQRFA